MVRKNPNRDEWKMPMELGQERFILCLNDGLFLVECPMISVGQQPKLTRILNYSYSKDSLSVWRESFVVNHIMPQLDKFTYLTRFFWSCLFLTVSIFYLLCLKFNLMDFFHALLEKVGFSLGGRALSFALRGLGCCCSAGLALTVGFALRALLTGEDFTHMMIPFGEGTSGASSSESQATPASPSDSLIGHASSETDSDKERFLTPPQSVSSASSSSTSTPGIDSASTNGEKEEQRYSFTYIKPESQEHEHMFEKFLLPKVRDKLEEWNQKGKIDAHYIENEELYEALKPRLGRSLNA